MQIANPIKHSQGQYQILNCKLCIGLHDNGGVTVPRQQVLGRSHFFIIVLYLETLTGASS